MIRRGTHQWGGLTHAMRARWRGLALQCPHWTAVTVLLACCFSLQATAASAAGGSLRIPLGPMGYQTLSPEFLIAGSSMLTVDFVDNDHLLITFNLRRLMKREPNDPADDADRTVGAFLVGLPSGKVLARAEWRMHDRAQYLWNLGHGRFLLRVRDRLTIIAPLESTDPNEVFRQELFLRPDRHIVAVQVSADSDLLTVESTKWSMGAAEPGAGFSAETAPVQVSFFRLNHTAGGLVVTSAGTVRTKTAIVLPLTAAGRLDAKEKGKDRWLFNLIEHAGKVHEVGEFQTSCIPRSTFVGRGEFVVFGCRGQLDKVEFAGFNMKGEEMWQQNFYDTHVSPTFSFVPETGRFALGRTVISSGFDPSLPLSASQVSTEEVRVYQTYSGKILFKTNCTPVQRAGQNFALSPEGLRLAVVRESLVQYPKTKDTPAYTQTEAAVEIYTMPALSAEDQAAVKDAQAHAPSDTGARIDQALIRTSAQSGKAASSQEPGPPMNLGQDPDAASGADPGSGQTTPTAPAADAESEPGTASQGDPQDTGPRKPPTLYGPDEKHPQTKPQ